MVGKKYDYKQVEENRYDFWLEKGYFKSGDLNKKPFCIVMPPPNITGKLHLGHALDTTLEDVIIRYKRMNGFDALFLPGMDHAGIATQAKIDQKLKDLNINPREISKEKWLSYAWDWKKEYANYIRNQWKKLGLSVDYDKEKFTMNEEFNKAVNKVFIEMYNKNLIYRGKRIINWDPEAMTALSNIEVIYKEEEGIFYHLKYMLDETNYIEVVTTRPETIFGDVAVAVNQDDKRYNHLIGKEVLIPLINKKIPIISDIHANMDFGSGAVKITPAHDLNDYEVGIRHNLEQIICINKDGTMNENAFSYKNLDRFECRKQIVLDLKKSNLLIKEEKMIHSVGYSERSNAIIEPYLSNQWFVKMDELAKQAIKLQKSENKINFIPKRFEKIYLNWIENTMDWCISRQLIWGHQIPAWYKEDKIFVGEKQEDETWVRDNDVLDTWFSSALWPFVTLGWYENLDKRYFPTNLLVTGYDIIFFWVSRMIFQSLEFLNEKPFNDVLIHGLIRDKYGQKMSKSKGNGIDPMDIMNQYGTDSLRYFLVSNNSFGQDFRYDDEKLKSTWNFINKIWNASRYVLINLEDFNENDFTLENLDSKDKWILTKLNNTIKTVNKYMEKYEFNNATTYLYNFIWNDYCDWYIELSKIDMSKTNKSVLIKVLSDILKMMHPFTPFVTEEIYQKLPIHDESIMISNYPIYDKNYIFKEEQDEIDTLISFIKYMREIKLKYNVKEFWIENIEFIKRNQNIILKLLKINKENIIPIELMNSKKNIKYSNIKLEQDISIEYVSNITENDIKKELLKEKEILENIIKKRQNLLNNENYINKAPKNVVELDKEKLKEEQLKLTTILEKLNKEE